ncbi:hypothetical protein J3R83DRAFT_13927 [Lanmaoa asiatica]|nr:hypothetical protein J3R83DRAFT_13927 [Lanmaoa asiatica]
MANGTMLSNFIRRNGKRKGNKVNKPRSHRKSPSASPSLVPSVVFDINEESPSLSAAQNTRLMELNLSVSNEEWFPQELLRRRSRSPACSPHRVQNATAIQNDLTQETHADSSPALLPSHSDNVAVGATLRKKSIPAPILIPDADRHMPNVQIGHSVVPTKVLPFKTSQPNANHASLVPSSPSTSDNLSAISGTTLAHVLIGSTFVLSSSEHRGSRHRSGVVRQDSATLPCGEAGFLSNSGRSSSIPPVPPVPAILVPSKPSCPPTIKSGASTASEYPMSECYITSPEILISSVIPRRTSFTQEILSPTASTSIKAPPSDVPNTTPQQKSDPVLTCIPVAKDGVFNESTTPAEVPSPNSQETTQHLSQEGSSLPSPDNHSLDEFDFVPLQPLVKIASPDSDSSASYTAPPLKRSDTNRGQRKCKAGKLNLIWNGCMIGSLFRSKFESKNFFTAKDNSLADGIPGSHHGHSILSATMSEHDYGELRNYDLTVSPESSASSHIPSSALAGYQTFPETPMVFSPLWSPAYTLLAKSDSQVLRRRPPSPGSAGFRSGKSYSSVRIARRQLDNSDGPARAVLLRRSQSSSLPRQKTPSPKQPESNLSLSAQVNNEAGIPEETNQLLTKNTVESHNSVELRSSVRPHPLSHISSSSSYLSEEEALQALAPHSAPSLPYAIIGDVDASPSPTTVPASVIDPSVESPTSVPPPESTDESTFNSPGLTDSVTAASRSTSSLQSSIPTATTVVSQYHPPKSLSSTPSSSLGESSFLPSPSSPASSNDPPPLSPMPAISSSAVWVSPSPSFVSPPPYHAVVSQRTAHHPGFISTSSLSPTSSTEPGYQCSRQASNSFAAYGSVRSRVLTRPPLPIGPRKPSGPGQVFGSFVPGDRGRNGSISSVGSGDSSGSPRSLWRKLQSAVSKPLPKFQSPPPKWRGLTLEAAQWTFTSAQLREMVSQAIQQSAEGSSLRFLSLETLEGEIADEMHRLELQHTDVKAQYKALVRKRWTLMGALAGHIEGVEMNGTATASRTMEELTEVLLALDHLADKMHDIVLQLAQLKSLGDVHNASALAMAVRKINGLFVRQMAEKERLQDQVDTLQTERDEAWKHAEDIAQDYDTLNDRVSETTCTSGDVRENADVQSLAGSSSKRSTRISAVRKSSTRQSQAGLRSRSKHRQSRCSSNAMRPSSLALEGIPPVPRLPVNPPSIGSATMPIPTGTARCFIDVHISWFSVQLQLGDVRGVGPSRGAARGIRDARLESPAQPGVVETPDAVGPRQAETVLAQVSSGVRAAAAVAA